jgi:hypothetical protein
LAVELILPISPKVSTKLNIRDRRWIREREVESILLKKLREARVPQLIT